MKSKDFLSIKDIIPGEFINLIQTARDMKEHETPQLLMGKTAALIFEKPSLRTRVSFEVGIKQMGGTSIFLSNSEIGLGIREPVSDVAMVLDRLVDVVIARVYSHQSLIELSNNTSIPVINALSDIAHPCQALGDCLTIFEQKEQLEGLSVAFVGDGNNIAGSLALACAYSGMNFGIASPQKYQLNPKIWKEAQEIAQENNTNMQWSSNVKDIVSNADVVYTDVWVSMGDEDEKEERLSTFSSYQVNEKVLSFAKNDCLFMHDMPAHRGEEISINMLDHPNSVVYQQAENRLHAQKAVIRNIFESSF
ncbi:MAG: ornithine carbamoyltransferase [SAR202 cluster bacterium]|nr:ornithine carbamoyltransferase [SAR202 cluster bacterium]|tara:strand:- start:8923 stop:9843 length:921 start_codon:yes stop_codon:yes gene_type:complete